jgi:isoquinoline 1-oxidoreductase subunit beta
VALGSSPDAASAAGSFAPNAWVTIGEDNIVTIVPPAVEMGQGVRTSLPLILAEDFDVEWSKVRLAETPDDDKIYGNPVFNHQLTTVGSLAVTGYYDVLRQAGAQARKVLIANAAAAWKVPAEELTTEPGMVVHAKSKRKISYGELAKTATVPNPLPEVTKADLKTELTIPADRQGYRPRRRAIESQRHGAIRHRHRAPRHAVRLGTIPAGAI